MTEPAGQRGADCFYLLQLALRIHVDPGRKFQNTKYRAGENPRAQNTRYTRGIANQGGPGCSGFVSRKGAASVVGLAKKGDSLELVERAAVASL